MNRFLLFIFALMMTVAAQAQFINNGATVTIQSGATLRVETDIQNNGTGTITNNGTIEVSGNFSNAGTATLTGGVGLVKFIGTANTTLDTGGDVLFNVEMAKTGNATVALSAPATIGGDLNFTGAGAKLILGTHNLTMTKTSPDPITAVDHGTNGYVVTDGSGQLVKGINANNASFVHEIGDMNNYTPLSSDVTGSYASATIGARTVDAIHPNKPAEADSHLSRYWVVNASGITSYDNLITGTYASTGDAVGDPSRIKGASFAASNWSFTNAATNGSSTVTGRTTQTSADFTGMNALNKVDLMVFLSGPLVGTAMTNALQIYDPDGPGPLTTILSQTSPYGSPTTTYNDISNPLGVAGQVVDWVKVEVRDAVNLNNIRETKSLLLKTNGHIVDQTGNIPYFKDYSSNVRYAIHHRNHMAILCNSTLGVFEGKNESYNTSTSLTQVVNSDVINNPQLRQRNGIWCMVSGDLNSDLVIDGNDPSLFFTPFNNGDFDMYMTSDLNLDGVMDGNDPPHFFYGFNLGLFSEILNY